MRGVDGACCCFKSMHPIAKAYYIIIFIDDSKEYFVFDNFLKMTFSLFFRFVGGPLKMLHR